MESSIVQEPEILDAGTANFDREKANAEWARSNLLSLGIFAYPDLRLRAEPDMFCPDGGGIRGYWSLLALQKLMEHIADIEDERPVDGKEVFNSFHPRDWPDNVSRIPSSAGDERNRMNAAENSEDKCKAIQKARRFLPCHYFDYICGSSTGA